MNLCRKMMKDDGLHWKISAERREEERKLLLEKEERLQVAGRKQEKAKENHKCKGIQKKITECLKELPENRKKVLKMEEDKMNTITLKEAKMELWKKWGQEGEKAYHRQK